MLSSVLGLLLLLLLTPNANLGGWGYGGGQLFWKSQALCALLTSQLSPGKAAHHPHTGYKGTTPHSSVGIIANTAAQRITAIKNINPDGSILEIVIWRVPKPVPPTEHGYKYRAVYVVDGVRIVSFDNERGKGDHCHMDGKELPYTFTSVYQLVEDFIEAVETRRAS